MIPGRGSDEEERREELMEERRKNQMHSTNLGQREQPSRERDFLKELVDSDADPQLSNHLDVLKSKDLPLANYTEAEVNELKWLNRAFEEMWRDMHPPPESVLQGNWRKALMDDELEGFSHVDAASALEISQFIQIIAHSRATRGRQGWQQEQLDKSIRVSETREQTDDDDGGWLRG